MDECRNCGMPSCDRCSVAPFRDKARALVNLYKDLDVEHVLCVQKVAELEEHRRVRDSQVRGQSETIKALHLQERTLKNEADDLRVRLLNTDAAWAGVKRQLDEAEERNRAQAETIARVDITVVYQARKIEDLHRTINGMPVISFGADASTLARLRGASDGVAMAKEKVAAILGPTELRSRGPYTLELGHPGELRPRKYIAMDCYDSLCVTIDTLRSWAAEKSKGEESELKFEATDTAAPAPETGP